MNRRTDYFWHSSRHYRNRFRHDQNDLEILLDSSHEYKWEFPDYFLVWSELCLTLLHGTNFQSHIHLVHYHKGILFCVLDARNSMQTYDHWNTENSDYYLYLMHSSQTPLKWIVIGQPIRMQTLPKHSLYWRSESSLHNFAARWTVHHSWPWDRLKNKNGKTFIFIRIFIEWRQWIKKLDLYIQPYAYFTCEPDVGQQISSILYFQIWESLRRLWSF